uniref:Chromo domain-containing protein n=1 Tax=Syphacia muris TaxID=451379 RepID=A0A0N5AAY0_9BILA
MPKKDTGSSKETKEKGAAKREAASSKQSKGREKELSEKNLKKEPSTSKDFKGDVKEGVTFELNSKVLCKYRDSLYYEAKIIAIDDTGDGERMFTVHYQGWNSRHDEKIPQSDVKARFLQCTEENLEMARVSCNIKALFVILFSYCCHINLYCCFCCFYC